MEKEKEVPFFVALLNRLFGVKAAKKRVIECQSEEEKPQQDVCFEGLSHVSWAIVGMSRQHKL